MVDDPFDFGAIAAANALSDVYAMGGEPLFAINLVAFPDGYDLDILIEILRGGAELVKEVGVVIAGGHTVTDKEPKYGLAVTGRVDPSYLVAKGGAMPGDVLILTKPLGSGIITTAHKQGRVDSKHLAEAVRVMKRTNKIASRIALNAEVHAMTDITGFGLVGHALEMAKASDCVFHLNYDDLPWLPGISDYLAADLVPGGTQRNRAYFEQWIDLAIDMNVPEVINRINDPQTSGGLLMAIPSENTDRVLQELEDAGETAAIIGKVVEGDGRIVFETI